MLRCGRYALFIKWGMLVLFPDRILQAKKERLNAYEKPKETPFFIFITDFLKILFVSFAVFVVQLRLKLVEARQ